MSDHNDLKPVRVIDDYDGTTDFVDKSGNVVRSYVADQKVEACPEACDFDWQQFHRDLDTAIAHAIEDSSDWDKPIRPSKTNLYDFMVYSIRKRTANEKH